MFPALASFSLWLVISLNSLTTFIFNPATTSPFQKPRRLAVPKLSWYQIRGNSSQLGCRVGKSSRTYTSTELSISSPRIGRKISFWIRRARLGRARITMSTNFRLEKSFVWFLDEDTFIPADKDVWKWQKEKQKDTNRCFYKLVYVCTRRTVKQNSCFYQEIIWDSYTVVQEL